MRCDLPTPLLGGLSPAVFMRRHWQRRPLLVRQALPGVAPPVSRAALFSLAGQDGVESRLVQRQGDAWSLRHGPLPRRALPPRGRPGWTLLVQGVDLHVPAAHALLSRFRFVPDARLDDLMISWASDGGGVGAHVDAYDVFLVQVQGRRHWRVGRVRDAAFVPGAPLRLLQRFEPEAQWTLEPGDLLYLPPGWGHDGVAVGGDCMTCSVGFRAPSQAELVRELLPRLADDADDARAAGQPPGPGARYRDPDQPATETPGAIAPALQAFARQALQRALDEPLALARVLGEALSEPKPQVWFDTAETGRPPGEGVVADARSRLLYDAHHLFLNGDAWRVAGRDARLLRRLADERRLGAADCERLTADARDVLDDWVRAGWLHPRPETA